MLRVGLLGAGRAGASHASAYQKLSRIARLAMVFDASPAAAQRMAGQCAVQAAASVQELICSPDVDVVDVCVPTFLHREYVGAAAAAGKHVICEKPIALTVEDAEQMIRTCREAGVRLFIAHPTRFLPEYRRLKSLLDSGQLGRPLVAKTRRGGRHFSGAENWIDDAGKSGAIITEAMLHDFDLLGWFFGAVDRLYCAWRVVKDPCQLEAAFATLHFSSGVIAMVEGNRMHNDRFYNTLEIFCKDGLLAYDRRCSVPLTVTTVSFNGSAEHFATSQESPNAFDQFEAELSHFLTCIESGQSPIVTPEDAVTCLKIAQAALDSAGNNQAVKL